MLFNNQLYNSSGATGFANGLGVQLQNMNEVLLSGTQQQVNTMRLGGREGGIELPPILHPLS